MRSSSALASDINTKSKKAAVVDNHNKSKFTACKLGKIDGPYMYTFYI